MQCGGLDLFTKCLVIEVLLGFQCIIIIIYASLKHVSIGKFLRMETTVIFDKIKKCKIVCN